MVLGRVAKLLAAKQHSVVAPALTGLGERSHLLNPESIWIPTSSMW